MNGAPTSGPVAHPAASPSPRPAQATPRLLVRDVHPRQAHALEQAGAHPLLARLWAARGVRDMAELSALPADLLRPDALLGASEAAQLLADAIAQGQRLVVVADYDCDGATACAVALRGLVLLGADPARVGFVVPDRAVHGYGLTPPIVDLALQQRLDGAAPEVLITVDNGIASHAGVAHARACGLKVLVTDHHLPATGQPLPQADVIVNPNQPACTFESKAMAGVGVMFYVLLATRACQRARGAFANSPVPRLEHLLDLVALGTVADVVKLDANNRRLVALGLKRMRAGAMQPGLAALFQVAGRTPQRAAGFDLGFALGPRINAAGRLADMTLGIACLLTDDHARAAELAQQLDAINRERRSVEAGMREQAQHHLELLLSSLDGEAPPALALFDEGFHEGVVGIVAGRIKDQLHRPTFVFARGADGALKGSGRSIPGFHLRDALDWVAKAEPDLLKRFGGHAMAAGCTLAVDDVPRFKAALQDVAGRWLDAATLQRCLRTDGELPIQYCTAETAQLLGQQVWGQGFEAPLFCDTVRVLHQRLVGQGHLKLKLDHQGQERDGIWFGRDQPVPDRVRLAYRLEVDEYNGQRRVQWIVEAAQPA